MFERPASGASLSPNDSMERILFPTMQSYIEQTAFAIDEC